MRSMEPSWSIEESSMNRTPSSASCPSKKHNSSSRSRVKAVEIACNVCLLCVSCPVSIAWCFIKLPCEIGWRLVKKQACCLCAHKRVCAAEYSSFSDIEDINHAGFQYERKYCSK